MIRVTFANILFNSQLDILAQFLELLLTQIPKIILAAPLVDLGRALLFHPDCSDLLAEVGAADIASVLPAALHHLECGELQLVFEQLPQLIRLLLLHKLKITLGTDKLPAYIAVLVQLGQISVHFVLFLEIAFRGRN